MGTIDHRYLRPIKARHRQGMLDEPFSLRADLVLWTSRNATIFPLHQFPNDGLLFGRGGVADADGKFVSLSGIPNRIERTYDWGTPDFRDEKVCYCGYLVPQWGHFLVEGVARLWYFLENDPSIDKYVFFVEENNDREIRGNYREFLELLGIWDKLEIINRPTTYREVVVPELSYLCKRFYSTKFLDIFNCVTTNALTSSPATPFPPKIYFSRSKFRKQGNELNEFGHDFLDNFMEKNGFILLSPEKVSLKETIGYLHGATVVATLSGSVAHNLLFVPPQGTDVLVLERWVFNNDFQTDIDRIKDLNTTYIDANLPLYTTNFGGGPYIVGYSEEMQRYVQDNNLLPPDAQYLTETYRRKCFANYMQAYWNTYRYRWFMEDWYCLGADYLWEGYQAGYRYFAPYLDGEKPFFWYQWLYPHYIKQFIKRLLRKLGLYH